MPKVKKKEKPLDMFKAAKTINSAKMKGVKAKVIDLPKNKFTADQAARIKKAREQLKQEVMMAGSVIKTRKGMRGSKKKPQQSKPKGY